MKTPNARLAAILKWTDKRGINQIYAYFRGSNPKLEDHGLRIGSVLRARIPKLTDEDTVWLDMIEEVMEAVDKIAA